jgi:hypothetical protein
MAKAEKKDHKGMASEMVKGLINTPSKQPLQTNQGNIVTPIKEKESTDKFTVEIESNLMKDIRLFSVNKSIKLRPLFEKALKEYITNHVND